MSTTPSINVSLMPGWRAHMQALELASGRGERRTATERALAYLQTFSKFGALDVAYEQAWAFAEAGDPKPTPLPGGVGVVRAFASGYVDPAISPEAAQHGFFIAVATLAHPAGYGRTPFMRLYMEYVSELRCVREASG